MLYVETAIEESEKIHNVWYPTRHAYQQMQKFKSFVVYSHVEPVKSAICTVAVQRLWY